MPNCRVTPPTIRNRRPAATLTPWLLAAAIAGWADGRPAVAERPVESESRVDFAREIQPLLARRCFACHGPDQAEGGLRLDGRDAAHGVLDSGGRAIVAGKPEQSTLLARVAAADETERMPPEGPPLTAAEVDRLRRWIVQGADWPEHWAFRPPLPVEPPAVAGAAWVRTPVDQFILARLEQHGLQPAPPAGKPAWLRRVTFDLTGLPPTPEELQEFLADTGPDAHDRVIDRLLDSPHYGERWGRHWLDLVRFAETNSFERDGIKPNAWKYRDYVIRSFNADKPYDQFVREQLAGDELLTDEDWSAGELSAEACDALIATGFYRLGLWDDEPADLLQARYDELDDLVATTGQVFLGLTFNCARCHDHKIDPIPQADYYRLLAVFHEVYSYGRRSDQRSWNQIDVSPAHVAQAHAAHEAELRAVGERMQVIEQRGIVKMPAEDQRASETRQRQKLLDAKLRDYLDDDDWQTYAEMKQSLEALRSRKLPPRSSVLGVVCQSEPPPTHILLRGNPHVPGPAVEPAAPQLFGGAALTATPRQAGSRRSSGRRLALADWITASDNRLSARVIANRVWQHHFGRGLVRTSSDFGQLGTPPTHPELLDWLAQELVRGGWRIKSLHRLILRSNAYRMSSQADERALAIDPLNDQFWRFDMRRLSAEEVRDATLAVSGRLNRKMYGPGFYSPISAEVLQGQSRPGEGWGTSPPDEQSRRSIYIHVKRSLITPALAEFDFPETDASCAVRFATTQPAQALDRLNGELLHAEAGHFAERLRGERPGDLPGQVARALELALCRAPQPDEVGQGLALVEQLSEARQLGPDEALRFYCLLVLNLNEFLYLD